MSINKNTTVDQITVTENGIILYREATRIMEDGEQLSQTYHRSSISPGASLDNVPPQVALIAQATWTPENIAPVTQAVTEAIAVQQAAIAEAAAKKAEAEAAITEAAAKKAEAEAAKAAAEAAEQAAKAAEASAKAAADAAEKENARLAQALAVAKAAAKAAADKQAFDDAVAAAVREAA